ncbi:MAG: ubiquinol-cytochrome c reductase iron-sulfur subunit [Cyanobacteria bacterium J06643_4]
MKRRDFVNWMGAGALAASLPIAIAACTPKSDTSDADPCAASDASGDTTGDASGDASGSAGGFVAVGTMGDLAQQGYITNEEALADPVIVIEDPTTPDSLIALSAKCTHSGCTVAWQEDLFACPCHASKFNPDGSVVDGPASEPLARYPAKIEGDTVLVSAT